jgi:hypothetical protein
MNHLVALGIVNEAQLSEPIHKTVPRPIDAEPPKFLCAHHRVVLLSRHVRGNSANDPWHLRPGPPDSRLVLGTNGKVGLRFAEIWS